jgi:hypothetical protein
MYANQLSVYIPQGVEGSDGYVSMHHNTQYSIRMKNDRNVPCDAVVTVDGNHIGTWRIQRYGIIEVDRPADKARRLTFYRLDSAEAQQAQLVKNDSLGLVSVEFKPEKKIDPVMNTFWREDSRESYGVTLDSYSKSAGLSKSFGATRSAGGTGLSGQSNQVFSSTTALDYDMANAFTINLRLIAEANVPSIEPLTPRATAVPPLIA